MLACVCSRRPLVGSLVDLTGANQTRGGEDKGEEDMHSYVRTRICTYVPRLRTNWLAFARVGWSRGTPEGGGEDMHTYVRQVRERFVSIVSLLAQALASGSELLGPLS